MKLAAVLTLATGGFTGPLAAVKGALGGLTGILAAQD